MPKAINTETLVRLNNQAMLNGHNHIDPFELDDKVDPEGVHVTGQHIYLEKQNIVRCVWLVKTVYGDVGDTNMIDIPFADFNTLDEAQDVLNRMTKEAQEAEGREWRHEF